jgi:hypothetical protein
MEEDMAKLVELQKLIATSKIEAKVANLKVLYEEEWI